MKINAYLYFDGTCEEAFKFYENVLGGKIEAIIRYDEMPEGRTLPPESAKSVMYTKLTVGDNVLMGSDAPPPYFLKAQGVAISITVDTPSEAKRLFADLSKDAETLDMPLGETSWSQQFAMFTDRFGTSWIVNCPKPM